MPPLDKQPNYTVNRAANFRWRRHSIPPRLAQLDLATTVNRNLILNLIRAANSEIRKRKL